MPIDPAAKQRCLASFARQGAMTAIGASVTGMDNGQCEITLPFKPELTQQHGFIHAGFTAMIADTACGFAALSLMPEDAAALTTEFKINLLAPAKGERLIAIGRVVRPGKKLMVCLGEVFAEEGGERRQVALLTSTMMVVETTTGLRD
jgi:uncharacterized protein (TIGR00369 family)